MVRTQRYHLRYERLGLATVSSCFGICQVASSLRSPMISGRRGCFLGELDESGEGCDAFEAGPEGAKLSLLFLVEIAELPGFKTLDNPYCRSHSRRRSPPLGGPGPIRRIP
jgi:hypothetical protein